MERNGQTGRLRIAAAYTILAAFTVSIAVDMISTTYEPPTGVQALAGIVGIWLFGNAGRGRGEQP